MKKIKKESVKPFILGIIFTIVVGVLVYGGYIFIINRKDNKPGIIQDKREIVTINGIKYNVNESKNTKVCDAFDDIMYYNYATFVSNDGTIYKLNDMKYSETNQNCKILDENIKIKEVINNYYVSEDNKVYFAENFGEDGPTLKEATDNEEKFVKQFIKDDIKFVKQYSYKEDYESKEASKEYLVLKDDGKIYKYSFVGVWDSYYYGFNYKLDKEEVYKEYKNEKIKRFDINSDTGGYIITDKNVYLSYATNKKCLEYTDVKCEYDYKKNEYLTKYKDSILSISNEGDDSYFSFTTIDKNYNLAKINED